MKPGVDMSPEWFQRGFIVRGKSTEVICSAISEREETAPRERCFSDSHKQALIILKTPAHMHAHTQATQRGRSQHDFRDQSEQTDGEIIRDYQSGEARP